MAHGADAAEALHHDRSFPIRTPLDEFLEPAKFDDVEPRLSHPVVLIHEQGDLPMAFHPRDGFDHGAGQGFRMAGGFELKTCDGAHGCSWGAWHSVETDEGGGKARIPSSYQRGEEIPEGVGRRGTTRKEIVDLHDVMQGAQFIEEQWEFWIIGNMREFHTGASNVGLLQALLQCKAVAHGWNTAGDAALAHGYEDPALVAELAEYVHVIRIADTAFDEANVHGLADVFEVVDGTSVEFNQLQ